MVVAFKEDESEAILSKETEVPTKAEPYHIQLWSSLGLSERLIQTDQPEYQLDLTGVPPGFYYVHVIKGSFARGGSWWCSDSKTGCFAKRVVGNHSFFSSLLISPARTDFLANQADKFER